MMSTRMQYYLVYILASLSSGGRGGGSQKA